MTRVDEAIPGVSRQFHSAFLPQCPAFAAAACAQTLCTWHTASAAQLLKRARKNTLSLATENVSPIALGKGGQQVARRHDTLDLREE